MGLILDTSAYSAAGRGHPQIVAALHTTESILLPTVVIGELLYGFYKGRHTQVNEQALRDFMSQARVSIVPVNFATAEQFGALKFRQVASGQTVTENDLWIAAVCLQLNQPLLTLDSDFERIAGLEIVVL